MRQSSLRFLDCGYRGGTVAFRAVGERGDAGRGGVRADEMERGAGRGDAGRGGAG